MKNYRCTVTHVTMTDGFVSNPILTSPRWLELSIYGWTNDLNNDVVFKKLHGGQEGMSLGIHAGL